MQGFWSLSILLWKGFFFGRVHRDRAVREAQSEELLPSLEKGYEHSMAVSLNWASFFLCNKSPFWKLPRSFRKPEGDAWSPMQSLGRDFQRLLYHGTVQGLGHSGTPYIVSHVDLTIAVIQPQMLCHHVSCGSCSITAVNS